MSIVYLIGAGPGDPGLITVRGLQCLAAADVVLYDHLVPARLLRAARADAEQIDVGTAALQPLEQEAICYLLAEKAREGKIVARLKWGDPFVFDSGGSEALFLHEQGVRFEVVPGIPAGIAVPGYAGIPITYPGGGDTVTFIRGHEDEGKTRCVDRLGQPGASRRHARLLRRAAAAAGDAARAARARTAAGRLRGGGLRRHAPDAADHRRHARRDCEAGRAGRRSARPRCWSSVGSWRCANTCAGSTHGRCSASASW